MAQTILVIDDSASQRQIVAMALKGAGYTVLEAGDGLAALALLDGRKIGMAVCDVNMPRMNGIEFVKAAKALPAYRFLPVLMLTTESRGQGLDGEAVLTLVTPQRSLQALPALNVLIQPAPRRIEHRHTGHSPTGHRHDHTV